MKIIRQGETLRVEEIEELATASAPAFRSALDAALSPAVTQLVVDLSCTGFVDCGGLGTLVALRKHLRRRNAKATVRLLNPTRSVQRIIHLTRLDHIFPIDTVQSDSQDGGSGRFPAKPTAPNPSRGSTPILQ